MWQEIKTRQSFSRLADGADTDRRPAVALARRLRTRVAGFRISPSRCRGSLVPRHSPLITEFLIANAGLEFRVTPFKHTHLKIPYREYIAVFRFGLLSVGARRRGEWRKSKEPALKRTIGADAFSGAINRSSPRMNAGAPTESQKRRQGCPSFLGQADGTKGAAKVKVKDEGEVKRAAGTPTLRESRHGVTRSRVLGRLTAWATGIYFWLIK